MNKKLLTVRAKKPKKVYELFYLLRTLGGVTEVLPERNNGGEAHFDSYQDCWEKAKNYIKEVDAGEHYNHPRIYAILITSNHGTQIVVKMEPR